MARSNYPQKIWMRSVPGRGNGACRDPQGEGRLACLVSGIEARVARAETLTPNHAADE